MIRHTFAATVKKDVSEEKIKELVNSLQSLRSKFPQVQAGKNLGWYSNDFQIILSADFKDKQSWEAYVNSPEHMNIAKNSMEFYEPGKIFIGQIELI